MSPGCGLERHACHVAARSAEAGNKPYFDRDTNGEEHDRNRGCRSLHGNGTDSAPRNDQVGLGGNGLRHNEAHLIGDA